MPRPTAPRVSDEQTWIIATAPGDVHDRDLATALGLTESAVHARRWAIRTKGWTCRIRFEQCLHCGGLITMHGGRSRTDRPYHPKCSPAASRARHKAFLAAREDVRIREQQRGQAYARECQEESLLNAVNRGLPWTESEDAWLEANSHLPIRELAAELGRTYSGVKVRRRRVGRG